MKRSFLILVAIAGLLASCSINIDSVDQPKDSKRTDSVAVNFGFYMNRNVATKAGLAGELTTDRLKGDGGGFGVFSYYGNGALYNETSKPDFMYNQLVSYNTSYGVWTYEPVKYWPNEYGAEASSEAADRLTFFAYAPYAAVTPSTGMVTGDATSGIIGMSRNIATGDPLVMYEANLTPGSGVDLCWGVADDDFTSSVDGNSNNVAKGSPFINVVKPKTGDRIAFDFHHSLAQLNVQVDTDIDVESHAGEELANDGTRIYVRSVTFSGFALRGSLNLNSNTTSGPAWFDISGTGRVKRDPVTIHDGRTDGIEGMATAADPNETPAGLNPAIIQSQPYDPAVLDGVKHETVNLFDSNTATNPIMVVPTSGVPLSVTIVYDIETADPKLLGYLSDGVTRGVSVENVITKPITQANGDPMVLEAGKRYVVNLHLGLTSVKLDAVVKTWVDTDPSKVDLPENITSIGSVELTSGGNPLTEVTVWKNQSSLTAPDVTVRGSDGNPMSGVTINWVSDNTSVASVNDNGAVDLAGVSGTAKITATATRAGMSGSASASYNVYVNEVTGISVAPATSTVGVAGKVTITATLTHTGLGTVAGLPTISWVSGSTSYVTISSSTGSSTQATGVAEGSSSITASVDAAYVADGVSASASATVNCRATINMAFRGYWVSPGILYRESNGNYGLTNERDGDNFSPFELSGYYNKATSISDNSTRYYYQWNYLYNTNELGPDPNNTNLINATSTKLPAGWKMPTGTEWNMILQGEPKTPIYVNGKQLHGEAYTQGPGHDQWAGAYAFVRIHSGDEYYTGILLFRDGTTITCEGLNSAKVGTKAAYADNTLTLSQLEELQAAGCLFISSSGYYSKTFNSWRTGERTDGNYYTVSREIRSGTSYYVWAHFSDNFTIAGDRSSKTDDYFAVRLVKQATGPMYP